MSFTSQVNNVIQGDSATVAATWVPTLNAGVDQKKFMVTADPNEFMMNTPLILNDNYYLNSYDCIRATYVTDTTTQKSVGIQGVTANMAYLDSAFIEFPLVLSMDLQPVTGTAPQALEMRVMDCMNDLTGGKFLRYCSDGQTLGAFRFNQLARTFGDSTLDDNIAPQPASSDCVPYLNGAVFEAPSFWQMEIIQNITFEVGNNVQTLGRSAGQGMALIKTMNSLIAQDEKFIKMFGFFNSQAGLSPYNNVHYVQTDPLFSRFYQALTTFPGQLDKNLDDGTDGPWNASTTAAGLTADITIPIRIPFKMLNSAFNQPLETWWPAGMPYKITIDFWPVSKAIFTSPYQCMRQNTATLDAKSFPVWQWTGKVGVLNNVACYMRTHLLRQPTQEAINLQWTASPFLYQYITAEPQRIPCDGVNTLYNVNIATNQQCPTHIIFYCEWTNEPPNGVFPSQNRYAKGADLTQGITEGDTFMFKGYCWYVEQVQAMNDITKQKQVYHVGQRHGYRRNSPMPMHLNSLKFTLSGTKKYEIKWNNSGFINLSTGEEISKDLISFSAYNRHDLCNDKSIRNENYGIGKYYHLTIHPGLMLDVGYQSTDWGAQVINLEIEVFQKGWLNDKTTPQIPKKSNVETPVLRNTTPIPSTHRITVVKVLPEQYNLDINRNVSIVRYPAVTTTNGYILPTASSLNMN